MKILQTKELFCMKKYQIDLIVYRLSKAKEAIKSARFNYEHQQYYTSLNRSYYAVFNVLRALLIFDNFKAKTHKSVINFFSKTYIKTNIFPVKVVSMIVATERFRERSDYEDLFEATEQDTNQQLLNAEFCVQTIGNFIENRLKNIIIQP